MSIEFAAAINFNINGIFCSRRQLISKFKAHIVASMAREKSIDIGIYCRRRQYMLKDDNMFREYRYKLFLIVLNYYLNLVSKYSLYFVTIISSAQVKQLL